MFRREGIDDYFNLDNRIYKSFDWILKKIELFRYILEL